MVALPPLEALKKHMDVASGGRGLMVGLALWD